MGAPAPTALFFIPGEFYCIVLSILFLSRIQLPGDCLLTQTTTSPLLYSTLSYMRGAPSQDSQTAQHPEFALAVAELSFRKEYISFVIPINSIATFIFEENRILFATNVLFRSTEFPLI